MEPQTKPQREPETRTVPTEKTPLDKAIDEIAFASVVHCAGA